MVSNGELRVFVDYGHDTIKFFQDIQPSKIHLFNTHHAQVKKILDKPDCDHAEVPMFFVPRLFKSLFQRKDPFKLDQQIIESGDKFDLKEVLGDHLEKLFTKGFQSHMSHLACRHMRRGIFIDNETGPEDMSKLLEHVGKLMSKNNPTVNYT